jgi:hypothetical protein
MTPKHRLALVLFLAGVLAALSATAAVAQDFPAPTGDKERGRGYFLSYKCYACHGYTGQTGLRRLVPMRFPQEAFIGYVQNSPVPDMPAYRDVPPAKLADLYAYIRSIPADAPDVSKVPLLEEIRARAQAAKR